MRNFSFTAGVFALLFFVVAFVNGALAQEQIFEPTSTEVLDFLSSLPSLLEAGTLAIAAAVVQGLLLLARSRFAPLSDGMKLVVVLGLTWIAGILTLKLTSDIGWAEAFLHSNALAAFQVFAHQFLKKVVGIGGKKNA